jgi:hypothetical protein
MASANLDLVRSVEAAWETSVWRMMLASRHDVMAPGHGPG